MEYFITKPNIKVYERYGEVIYPNTKYKALCFYKKYSMEKIPKEHIKYNPSTHEFDIALIYEKEISPGNKYTHVLRNTDFLSTREINIKKILDIC